MYISAIIATYKRVEPLKKLLKTLEAQSYPLFEVIIGDQNEDSSVDTLLSSFHSLPGITTIHKVEGKNLSDARNRGIKLSKGEILFFPDDDSTIPPDFFQVAGKFFMEREEIDFISVPLLDNPSLFKRDDSLTPITHRNARTMTTASNLLFRRRVSEKTGLFDTILGLGTEFGSSEDLDYIFRVLYEGFRGVRFGGTCIFHRNPLTSYDTGSGDRAYQYNRGFGAFFAKHLKCYRNYSLIPPFLGETGRNILATLLYYPVNPGRSRYNLMSVRGKISGFLSYFRKGIT